MFLLLFVHKCLFIAAVFVVKENDKRLEYSPTVELIAMLFVHSKVEACVTNECGGPTCTTKKSKILIPKCLDIVYLKNNCNKMFLL